MHTYDFSMQRSFNSHVQRETFIYPDGCLIINVTYVRNYSFSNLLQTMPTESSILRAPYFAGIIEDMPPADETMPSTEMGFNDSPEAAACALAVACARRKTDEANEAKEAAAVKAQEASKARKHAEEIYFNLLKAASEKVAKDECKEVEEETTKDKIEEDEKKKDKEPIVSAWKASTASADSRVAMKTEKIHKNNDGKELVAVASLTIEYSTDEDSMGNKQLSGSDLHVCFPSFCI